MEMLEFFILISELDPDFSIFVLHPEIMIIKIRKILTNRKLIFV